MNSYLVQTIQDGQRYMYEVEVDEEQGVAEALKCVHEAKLLGERIQRAYGHSHTTVEGSKKTKHWSAISPRTTGLLVRQLNGEVD